MPVGSQPAHVPLLFLLGLVALPQHLGAEVGGLAVEQGHQLGVPLQGVAVVPCQWHRPEPGHHSLTLPMHLNHSQEQLDCHSFREGT